MRIVLPEGHQWHIFNDTPAVTEFRCHVCRQTFVHDCRKNTTNATSIKPHPDHHAHLMTERRAEEAAVARVRPEANLGTAPAKVAPKAPRRTRPRGIRKAGAGEFARCSRFAD